MHDAARHHARDHRKGLISRREFLTRATALGLGVPAAYALIGAVPARAEDMPVPGGVLRMQMPTLPLCDPRLADWPEIGNMLRGWLEPLVDYNSDGTFTGRLLERWEMSGNATALTMRLRDGVRWSNGVALTGEDVAWNLRRWTEDTPANGLRAVMSAVDPDAIAVDGPVLHLTLRHPDATLIASFSDYTALLVHPTYDGADPSVNPLGSGPYRPVLNEVGKLQALEKTEWWGSAVFGGPWIDRIEYVDLGTDPGRALPAARDGLIDAVDQSTSDVAQDLEALGWRRSEVESAATLAIRFQQHDPAFADRRVRRALQMAVDNQVILDIGLDGHGRLGANHHVCPLHPDFADVPPPEPDPAAARALLAEAGAAEAEYTLVSLDDGWQALSCDAVAAQLTDAGIRVVRRILPGRDYWPNWRSYPFSATNWNMRPLGVQVLRLAYRSDAPWNETGFANPAFDAALDRALSIVDAAERRTVMAELERILQEEGVLIQPYWRNLVRHASPALRGAEITPTLVHRHHEWWLAPQG